MTFGDIMQSKILYFDPEIKEACLDICRILHIDNMPAFDGKHYYELIKDGFEEREISDDQRLEVDDRIFAPDLIAKFRKNRHNVVFVFEGHVLRGVVHICDYNQDNVIQAIQDDVLAFERNLRQWLILSGFSNDHFMIYFKYKISSVKKEKEADYWKSRHDWATKKIEEMKNLSPFQLYDFSDLLNFVSSSFSKETFKIPIVLISGEKHSGIHELSSLRNLAMHGKNPITFDEPEQIYSQKSLEILFAQLEFLTKMTHELTLKIRNHGDYIKSIKIDNENKLRIIHEYHPKALWYFIGR
ncbi:MAG: hypothetical protein KBC43_11905 [Bacteroidales bacterium]|nr:hypothetical protein [Bacteroidales bacterium]